MKKLPVVSSDDVIRVLKNLNMLQNAVRAVTQHFTKLMKKGVSCLLLCQKGENCPKGLFCPFFSKLIYQKMILLNS